MYLLRPLLRTPRTRIEATEAHDKSHAQSENKFNSSEGRGSARLMGALELNAEPKRLVSNDYPGSDKSNRLKSNEVRNGPASRGTAERAV